MPSTEIHTDAPPDRSARPPDQPREREVLLVQGRDPASGLGFAVGVVFAGLAVAMLIWLLLAQTGGSQLQLPDHVNVNIDAPAASGNAPSGASAPTR